LKPDNHEHEFPISEILSNRWSPRAFSHDAEIVSADLGSSFEAAKWSPSSSNSQPWKFMVGLRGDKIFEAITDSMSPGNAIWAKHAPALIANIARLENSDGSPLDHAVYDLGQAVAHFTFQATVDGLLVHQMGGFDSVKLGETLRLSRIEEVVTLMAVGPLGKLSDLPEKLQARELRTRERKKLSEIVVGSLSY